MFNRLLNPSLARRVRGRARMIAFLETLAWTAVILAIAIAVRASADELSADDLARFERKLDASYATGDFVGLAVAVVERGQVKFVRAWGETEAGSNDAATIDTAFRLASVSKGFSSTLVGQLVEEGRLDWGDPLTDSAPEFRLKSADATSKVTIENVLSHRVGLPQYAYDNYLESGESVAKVLERTAGLDLTCQPGDCYGYQNVTYSLVGEVIAAKDGRDYGEAVRARLFTPLHMTDASVGLEGLESSPSWARPHLRTKRNGPWKSFGVDDAYYRVAAAGGINASINDLSQWLLAQLGYAPDVIDAPLLQRIHDPVVDTPQEFRKMRWMSGRLKDADYALGWRVYNYAGERMVLHAGGVAGYRAMVAMAPERDVGVAVLWNSSSGRGWRIMPTLMDAAFGLPEKDWLDVEELMTAAAEADGPVLNGSP